MTHKTIGDRLKYSLEIRKMTQREFAERLDMTEPTISRYIKGTRQPNADTIIAICRVLGVSADWLLGMI